MAADPASPQTPPDDRMEKLVALTRRRGFLFVWR